MQAVGTFINNTFIFQYNGLILTFNHTLTIEDLRNALIKTFKFIPGNIYYTNKNIKHLFTSIHNDQFIILLDNFTIMNNKNIPLPLPAGRNGKSIINVRIFNSYPNRKIIKNNCSFCLCFPCLLCCILPNYKKSLSKQRNDWRIKHISNYTVHNFQDILAPIDVDME